MPRRKQVYKITYPNGKIYVGMDLTGTALYMGSPSAYAQIVADLELDPDRFELILRKEIVWESETSRACSPGDRVSMRLPPMRCVAICVEIPMPTFHS
jgi:hypothetical protein